MCVAVWSSAALAAWLWLATQGGGAGPVCNWGPGSVWLRCEKKFMETFPHFLLGELNAVGRVWFAVKSKLHNKTNVRMKY